MDETEKRRRLRCGRLVATALLPFMAVLLCVSGVLKAAHPGLAWVQFFAEASLIGGLADWFAVVALFRHPLGVGLPHTAIIPRNKDRIGRELGRFVDENFLTPAAMRPWLAKQDVAGQLLRWASRPSNMRALLSLLADVLPVLGRATAKTGGAELAARALSAPLARLDLARLLASALRAVLAAGADHPALDRALAALSGWLDQNRALVKARFGEHSPLTSGFFDSFVVNRFIDGIIDVVHEIAADPGHEMRAKFTAEIDRLATRLETDPVVRQQAAEIQRRLLAQIDMVELIKEICSTIGETCAILDQDRVAAAAAWAVHGVVVDQSAVERINIHLSRIVANGLADAKLRLSTLVEDIMSAWDARFMAEKLELEVGHDLQFIRLNGMAVGGLVGLVLHPLLVLAGID
jgi:uncharacterized membrane-anchored protein YjiN (DUF445 family)